MAEHQAEANGRLSGKAEWLHFWLPVNAHARCGQLAGEMEVAEGLTVPQGACEFVHTWLASSQFTLWTVCPALPLAQVAQADEHRALWTEWNGMG